MKNQIDEKYYNILKKAFELECVAIIADLAGGYALHNNLEKYLELLKIDLGEKRVIKIMGKAITYINRITGGRQ